MNDQKDGLLIVISGPSGSGKGTIIGEYLKTAPPTFLSISATTREPRVGEVNGKNYHFMSKEAFKQEIDGNNMLEWAGYCENFYGTPKKPVYDNLQNNQDVILELDVVGAMNVKKNHPQGVYTFVLPPSMEILKDRLTSRGTEKADVVEKRLKAAKKEISYTPQYDYLLVNDGLSKAVDNLRAIIWAERSKMIRATEIINEVFMK